MKYLLCLASLYEGEEEKEIGFTAHVPMTMSTVCSTARQSRELFPRMHSVQPFAILPSIS